MKIRDIVELAAVLLQKQELTDSGIFTVADLDAETGEEIAANKELQLLIRCANLVIKEIACDYLPLIFTERLTCKNGNVPYGEFSKTLLEIKYWRSPKGDDVSFFTFPEYVASEDGEYDVTYTYVPDTKGFFEETDYTGTKITDRVIAYGTAAEFCLIAGLYDDALIWERRYKDALMVATRKSATAFLPRRRWW